MTNTVNTIPYYSIIHITDLKKNCILNAHVTIWKYFVCAFENILLNNLKNNSCVLKA